MASQNPRKRGPPTANSDVNFQRQSGHDRKRVKLQDARAIAIQSTDKEIQSGQLDVNSFIRSREFEIKALEDAMASSSRANKKRAFQNVPRSMRRRTASHNVKRVPKRLRSRHGLEMAEDNTPTVTSRRRKPTPHMRLRIQTAKKLQRLSQQTKNENHNKCRAVKSEAPPDNTLCLPPRQKSKFRKRQINKAWLPTHVWHAKRARMITRWRYSIAETPTEKSYRPTHKASTLNGGVAWDCSYFGTILVKGKEQEVECFLRKFVDQESSEVVARNCTSVSSGKRAWNGMFYEGGVSQTTPIAPVTILWCILEQTHAGKEKRSNLRQLFIRVHASAFYQVWSALIEHKKSFSSVSIEDLRFEIGSIVVTGPSATSALVSTLHPVGENPAEGTPEHVWNSLRMLSNPNALPSGGVLAFQVSDPRLRFPPRLPLFSRKEAEDARDVTSLAVSWPPDKTQGPAALFSRESRARSTKAQCSHKKINKRRSETMPGTYPEKLPTDPEIPIILVAPTRTRRPLLKGSSTVRSRAIGGWTLLLPWKWVQPVWYSLVNYPRIRFGGLNELKQVNYENCIPTFPDDYPGTKAGYEEEERKAIERKLWWERRPKQKRIAWESVDLGGGREGELGRGEWCDWEYLLSQARIKPDPESGVQNVAHVSNAPISSGDKELCSSILTPNPPQPFSSNLSLDRPPSPMDVDQSIILTYPQPAQNPPQFSDCTVPLSPTVYVGTQTKSQITPWTIESPLICHILSNSSKLVPAYLCKISKTKLQDALFTAKVSFLRRGSPGERARIYRIPPPSRGRGNSKIRDGWLALLKSYHQSNKHEKHILQAGNDNYPIVPHPDDLIGYITSGNYNLKEGMGIGIASLGFRKVFLDGKGNLRRETVSRYCVVREAGDKWGRLARWEVI